jgi:hypothetical protein
MEKNYKVPFYTLLGIVIGGVIVGSIFLIYNSTKKTDDNKSNSNSNIETVKEEPSNVVESNITSNVESNIVSNTNNEDEFTSEDRVVIEYLEEQYNDIKNDKTTKEKAKEVFTTTVDFLFNDGEIKGKTLKGLSSKGVAETTKLITKIEMAVENKFPGLIDSTKDKYKNAKEKIIEKYEETVENFCKDRREKCEGAKQDLEDLKKEYKETFKYLLEKGSEGIDKAKEKIGNWYSNYKNN